VPSRKKILPNIINTLNAAFGWLYAFVFWLVLRWCYKWVLALGKVRSAAVVAPKGGLPTFAAGAKPTDSIVKADCGQGTFASIEAGDRTNGFNSKPSPN
jgi:hypothetical protein